ncbi:MAG TPA: GrpB family protein [Ktedonobacterales bacterium]|nr:GrpB family protein [Ktedonobacterales bacterium]
MPDQRDEPASTAPTLRAPSTEEEILAVRIGETKPHNATVYIADYDPAWPQMYAAEANKIRTALGERPLLLEHVGSTSVPGLPAKPLIDILLVVADSADEAAYVPALEAAGYALRIREPDWYQHRVLQGESPVVNLHVFSPGCVEIRRMLLMRDRLRTNDADRDLYARTKRDLASREWKYIQNYADAKSAVVEAILARASADAASERPERPERPE